MEDQSFIPIPELTTLQRDTFETSDFAKSLRSKRGQIDIMCCITLYNETSVEIQSTIYTMARNIQFMQKEKNLPASRILVVLIQDGIDVYSRENDVGQEQTLYQDITSYGKLTGLYDFERIQYREDSNPEREDHTLYVFQQDHKVYLPKNAWNSVNFQVYTCFKAKNRGKLDSHFWFFEFSKQVNPGYIVLLDCGTEPRDNAIYNLLKEFFNDKKDSIAGVCGEIRVKGREEGIIQQNFLQMTQDIEYRLSHFMDKTLESLIGYISVLPGAFSAYRWTALNDNYILNRKYFYMMGAGRNLGCGMANMYLAEDRVLSAALVFKSCRSNLLTYTNKAIATTAAPDSFVNLLRQRRRWINGSFFTMLFVMRLVLSCGLWSTEHSYFRKFLIFAYILLFKGIILAMTYFSPAIYYVYFHGILTATQYAIDPADPWLETVFILAEMVYILLIIVNLIASLGSEPKSNRTVYPVFAVITGLLALLAVVCSIFVVIYYSYCPAGSSGASCSTQDDEEVQDEESEYSDNDYVVALVIIIFFGFVICSWFHRQSMIIVRGLIPFFAILPCYATMYLVFAFCNMHDVSWGSRSEGSQQQRDQKERYSNFRKVFVIVWVLTNLGFGFAFHYWITYEYKHDLDNFKWYIKAVSLCIGCIMISKIIGSILYALIFHYLRFRRWFLSLVN